jgi:hypothetical protein
LSTLHTKSYAKGFECGKAKLASAVAAQQLTDEDSNDASAVAAQQLTDEDSK